MSIFAPGDYPTGPEIDEAIRTARRERAKTAEELLGLAATAVKDAISPALGSEMQPAPATGGAGPRKGAG